MKKTTSHYRRFIWTGLFSFILSVNGYSQFTPGEGGSLPTFPTFTTPENKFSGFLVNQSDRENEYFGSGTRAIVEMSFLPPSSINATSYTLQYSTDNGSTWSNYQYYGEDLTTTGDNFSLNLEGSYKLRLLANGGPKSGYTSNEMYAPLTGVETRFAGWSLDESMFITGTMSPWVGRGLTAGFTVKKLSDDSEVANGLTYQWYRINPATYEMEIIPSATNLTYATTSSDLGYLVGIKATGDEVNAGGFSYIISSQSIKVPNKCFVSNVTESGFTLNLYKIAPGLEQSELTLYDKDYNIVPISSVAQGANGAIYNISATLSAGNAPYWLYPSNRFWSFSTPFMMMDEMEGVSFSFPTGVDKIDALGIRTFVNITNKKLMFTSEQIINTISVYSSSGELVLKTEINLSEGEIDLTRLKNGIYIINFENKEGRTTRKIQIEK